MEYRIKLSQIFKRAAVVTAITVGITSLAEPAQNTQTVDTRIGKLDFELGVPTKCDC